MTIVSSRVAVGSERIMLFMGRGVSGSSVIISTTAEVFLGGEDVTVDNGYPLNALSLSIDLEQGEALYAVASADTEVAVLAQGR